MSNPLTPTRRERQARAIRRWKSRERSTGPKTEEGEASASRHAREATLFRREMKRLHSFLRQLAQADAKLRHGQWVQMLMFGGLTVVQEDRVWRAAMEASKQQHGID